MLIIVILSNFYEVNNVIPEKSVGYLVNQTGRKLGQLLNHFFKPFGVTREQWSLLIRLYEHEGITQIELAKRIDKDQTNITRTLDQLERKGLAERRPNAADRRSYLAYRTPEGTSLIEQLLPIEEKAMSFALHGLSEDEVKLLQSILSKLTENATRYLNDQGNDTQE